MNEKNITYLFGAGASANAVPIVKKIPGAIDKFLKEIESNPDDGVKNLYITLMWMKKGAEDFGSIDIFAEKVYKSQNIKFKQLKAALGCFFTYIQFINNVDKRYYPFLSVLLNGKTNLPDKVNVLSWNYDLQFEKAYIHHNQHTDNVKKSLDDSQKKLNVLPSNAANENKSNTNKSTICKLNGTAAILHIRGDVTNLIDDPERKVDTDFMDDLLKSYKLISNSTEHFALFKFTFEGSGEDGTTAAFGNMVKARDTVAKKTSILIIIGYSFPSYNRDIDKQILGKMSNLERVYIQDLNAGNYIELFRSLKSIGKENIIPINNVEQFFIPNEFDNSI